MHQILRLRRSESTYRSSAWPEIVGPKLFGARSDATGRSLRRSTTTSADHPIGLCSVAILVREAKSALLFLYKEVLGVELPWLEGIQSAKAAARLPVVLTVDETRRLLQQLSSTPCAHRAAALRNRHADHGSAATASERHRVCAR